MTPRLARAMAAYNAEMNRRLIRAADRLGEAARRADGGAHFGSIHATLCHLLWADRAWMHRLAGWERPPGGIRESVALVAAWPDYVTERATADRAIEAWAAALTDAGLEGELVWFSGAAQREMRRPRWLLVQHMFNHQTHHRGQVHCLLTQAGVKPGTTDLPFR